MSTVAAIMVNWNGGELAVDSIRSIMAQSIRPVVWVVDNSSTDDSLERIEEVFPSMCVIRNDCNRGFAKANNQAIQAVGNVDYLLLINNDIILPDNVSLERVVGHLEDHPDIHGACGRFEYPSGEFQRFYKGLPTVADIAVNWGICRHVPWLVQGKRNRDFYLLDHDFSARGFLEQPAFACVLLRVATARKIGLMDERFPIFFNDVDYCWRWRSCGYKWLYFPEWRVVHHKSRSTGKMGQLLEPELASSAVRFAVKHFTWPKALIVRLAIILEVLWRKLRHGESEMSVRAIWRGEMFFLSRMKHHPPS